MKNVFAIAALLLISSASFAADKLTVDTDREKSDNVVSIEIDGGKGSAAEKLYNALDVTPEDDDAMGGRHGLDKDGKGISCSVENDSHVKNAYQCFISIDSKGTSIDPGS